MLDKEIILRKKINFYYTITFSLIISIILIFYLLFVFKFTRYYQNTGIVSKINNSYYLKINIKVEDMEKLINYNFLIIDKKTYYYQIYNIADSLLLDNNQNLIEVYLKLNLSKKYQIDNYVLPFKIEQERKKIINYLIDYF